MRVLRVLDQRLDALAARTRAELGPTITQTGGERLLAVARAAHALFDRETARVATVQPACGPGCFYCCHVHVDATIPEVLAVADFVRKEFAPVVADSLRERLVEWSRKTAGISAGERYAARIPCALLVEGRCVVHAVRPLRCRAFHSLSAAPCQEAFAGNEDADAITNPMSVRAGDAVERGFDEALADAGLSPKAYLLEAALLIALLNPDAAAAWQAGTSVFDAAESPR